MPTIDVRTSLLDQLIGRSLPDSELEPLLSSAKAELEGHDEPAGVRRVELKDTNRPDLWSTVGLARHLRTYLGADPPAYDFVSAADDAKDATGRLIEVDVSLEAVRPYIAGFAFSGPPLSEPQLLEIIQSQEKLSENFGQRRRAIAAGIYRAANIRYPVHYRAYLPTERSFVALGSDSEQTLDKILDQHPNGREYGHLVKPLERYPFLEDDAGNALSMPPVINSDHLGSVEVGDRELFVELTGLYLDQLLLAANIAACDLADCGYTIHPVMVRYPYDTPYGREIVCPFRFQVGTEAPLADAARLLGEDVGDAEALSCLHRMGLAAEVNDGIVRVQPPVFRNDFLHAVDVVEEIAVGRGLESFAPELPRDFTVGRLTEGTLFTRRVREALVGLGYQEMVFYYLASLDDLTRRMNRPAGGPIALENPMSESYAVLRDSNLPCLLAAESASQNATYPHQLFEVGKAVERSAEDTTGTRTYDILGMLYADSNAGFNEVGAHLSALLYYLSVGEHSLREVDDSRFLPGRSAQICVTTTTAKSDAVGIVGEFHPQVLENWGIQMPCAAVEIDLSRLWDAGRSR